MSNMSYCRFQNTVSDLRDCAEALDEILTGDAEEKLSDEELCAAKCLVQLCAGILQSVAERADMEAVELCDIQGHSFSKTLAAFHAEIDDANDEVGS